MQLIEMLDAIQPKTEEERALVAHARTDALTRAQRERIEYMYERATGVKARVKQISRRARKADS